MDNHAYSTPAQGIPANEVPSLGDAIDLVNEAASLVEAVFMAASAIGLHDATNAIQAVCSEADRRLTAIHDMLENMREVRS